MSLRRGEIFLGKIWLKGEDFMIDQGEEEDLQRKRTQQNLIRSHWINFVNISRSFNYNGLFVIKSHSILRLIYI